MEIQIETASDEAARRAAWLRRATVEFVHRSPWARLTAGVRPRLKTTASVGAIQAGCASPEVTADCPAVCVHLGGRFVERVGR